MALVYVCFKHFPNNDYPDEVLGVFDNVKLASNFAKEFPRFSMEVSH
jgi:hypothetical protein